MATGTPIWERWLGDQDPTIAVTRRKATAAGLAATTFLTLIVLVLSVPLGFPPLLAVVPLVVLGCMAVGLPQLRWPHVPEKQMPRWGWVIQFVLFGVWSLVASVNVLTGNPWWPVQASLAWVYLVAARSPDAPGLAARSRWS